MLLFNSVISGSRGSACLSSSRVFIILAASEGTSGIISLILPCGMACLETVLMIFLKVFSPLWTSMGGGSLANSSSDLFKKSSQSAFLKLMKVLFSLLMGLISVSIVRTIGRWSEPSWVFTSQAVYGRRARLAREKSGDEL